MYSFLTDVLVSFLLGSMVFFAAVVAPAAFKGLEKEQASRYLRTVFPVFFLWGMVLSLLILGICLFHSPKGSVLMAFVAAGFVYSRQWLTPRINAVRDLVSESDSPQHKAKFDALHRQSVLINLAQMAILITMLIA